MKLRTRYLIQPKFQLLFSSILILIALVCAILVGVVVYILIYTNNLIFVKYNIHTSPEYLTLLAKQGRVVIVAWLASFGAVAIVLFVAGIFLSHRMTGPLYALMREMKKLREGDLSAHLALRKRDEFKELKAPFNRWVEYFRKVNQKDIEQITIISGELKSLIETLKSKNAQPSDIAILEETLENLNHLLAEKEA